MTSKLVLHAVGEVLDKLVKSTSSWLSQTAASGAAGAFPVLFFCVSFFPFLRTMLFLALSINVMSLVLPPAAPLMRATRSCFEP